MMRKSEFGMKKKYLWYLPKSLSIVFLVLLTISCANEEKPKVNKTIKVEVMNVGLNTNNSQGKVAYNGTIEADVAIKSSFQVSGNVVHVPVSIGDFVKKNQLIAQIDATIYSSQYEQQLAQVRLAKENYERINNVFQKGSIAEIRMLEARSQYEQAQAAAKMAYENVRHAKLYAPMDGYVSDKVMDVGDLAQPGQPVVEIVNINVVKAVFPIPDGEINSITKGDSANVSLPTLDKSVIGIVDEVSIQSNQGSPVYTAYVKLNNPDKQIKPGMNCNVRLQDKVDQDNNVKEVIVIPSESIAVTEDGKQYVYIVDNGIAERKYIETGELYDSGIVVKKGLAKGDHLIISGYHKLTQSTPVEIVNDAK
ncbi:MAG: efflux RND transporter periplasmic adaptor subunit [Maribacter dokdonensis]|uniref:efflux RND transporter periplasmic adaptor subunit n=1 Tax=Maribacter dokdonensis TaxID=320912 RepID=UPI003296F5BE